jgi:hypothetical protein
MRSMRKRAAPRYDTPLPLRWRYHPCRLPGASRAGAASRAPRLAGFPYPLCDSYRAALPLRPLALPPPPSFG